MSKTAIKVKEVRTVGRPVRSARRAAAPAAPAESGGGSLLQEYLLTLRRHPRLLAVCAGTGVLLALLAGLWTLPEYQTRTSLDIRTLNGDFLNMRSVAPTGDDTPADADTNLQTQIKLLQSDTLQQQTIDHMLAQPHPATIEREDLFSRFRRVLHLGSVDPIPYREALGEAAQAVKVKPLGLTRLVEITCQGWTSQLAAGYCNTLITTYQEEDLQTRSQEATKVSGWLTRQVADIRQRVQDSEAQLNAAVGGNGLRLSQANTSIGEERLQALQNEVVKAQADRIQKEAAAQEARSSAPGASPEVEDNPAHRQYELKLADLQGQLAALVPPLTEDNPKVIKLRSQIREVEAGLAATATNSVARSSNELDAARHREQLLTVTYNAELATVSQDLQQSAKVSLLRSELESEQQLYQTLLQRAREAGFASALQASTIRVVDPALPPEAPFAPRRATAAGIGLFLGLLAGIALAFYRERTQNVFRMPGEIVRMLDVQELGVIPASAMQARVVGPSSPRAGLLRVSAGADAPAPSDGAPAMAQWDEKFSLAAEAYSNATFSILQAEAGTASRAYVVSSPKVGEGKTTITSNLGVALSKSKLRVVLVDGDLRRPSLHRVFGIGRTPGLRDLLRAKTADVNELTRAGILRETAFPNLSVIPAGVGDEDSVELLNNERLPEVLAELSKSFDVVLIDTPPALHMVDTRIIARACDGVILVVRAGVTTLDEAANARDLFDGDGVHLIGTILNDFNPHSQGFRGYYRAYEQYQKPRDGSEKAVNAA